MGNWLKLWATAITVSLIISITVVSTSAEESSIPEWIRNIATWWGTGQVSDEEFKNAIAYLINNGIITIEASSIERPFEELWFQTIYMTSEEWCVSEDYNEMMFYNEVADEYFLNYGYNPISHAPACLSIQGQGYDEINNLYTDVDLWIIIRDNWYGSSTLLADDHIWGYMKPLGDGQFVVDICACSVEIESQWGVWLLTHELGHFVIDDYLLPESMHEGWIHEIHSQIDECEGTEIDYYGYGTCTFVEQGIDIIDVRGLRYDVMPYITEDTAALFS